jgi:hypothetical protein
VQPIAVFLKKRAGTYNIPGAFILPRVRTKYCLVTCIPWDGKLNKGVPEKNIIHPDVLLGNLDVDSLETLGSFFDIEFHRIAFIQAAIARRIDGGVMNEYIFAAGALNESVTFFSVKPLDSSLFHVTSPLRTFPRMRAHTCVQPFVLPLKKHKNRAGIHLSGRVFPSLRGLYE